MSLITEQEYADTLRDWLGGDRVEFFPDWRTANSAGGFNARGVMHHWTAMGRGVPVDAQLMLLQDGRPGLDGPLCHLSPARNGKLWVVAGPRANANHAGKGSYGVYRKILRGRFDGNTKPRVDSIDGNSRLYGFEYMFHPDDGVMPDEQVEAGNLASAALAQAHGWAPDEAAGSNLDHYEWTRRKWDREVQNLANRTRAGVRTALRDPNAHRATPEDDMFEKSDRNRLTRVEETTDDLAQRLEEVLAAMRRQNRATRTIFSEKLDLTAEQLDQLLGEDAEGN